jgi:hypothetical protein
MSQMSICVNIVSLMYWMTCQWCCYYLWCLIPIVNNFFLPGTSFFFLGRNGGPLHNISIIQDARLINIKIKVQENNEEAIASPLKLRRACNSIIKSQKNQWREVNIHQILIQSHVISIQWRNNNLTRNPLYIKNLMAQVIFVN